MYPTPQWLISLPGIPGSIVFKPLIINNMQDLTSDGISVGNVYGLITLISSYLKRVKERTSPADLEKYLKKSVIQVPIRTEGKVNPKEAKSYGLLEPTKLLE